VKAARFHLIDVFNKKCLRLFSAGILVVALLFWAAKGANIGWNKTSVEIKVMDEITGIEASRWEPAFVPGVEFLGISLAASLLLFGISFLLPKGPTKP
jgi:hypothetical protein